jgi:membrane-bound lytic murein transglycosylase D
VNKVIISLLLIIPGLQGPVIAQDRNPYDIFVPDNKYAESLISKYRSEYLTPYGKAWLSGVLDNGREYRLYVRSELHKRGMPESLEYLPVVESEYNPRALSKSGATGLWQFMTNSIKPFLTKNEWLDERLDPWLSTDAALTKLQDNYQIFGDWALAIAAYNCGAGAMKRILDSAPEKSFWYIAEHNLIRDQSIQYVPKFIAISDIVQNCNYYETSVPEISADTHLPNFDTVTIVTQVSLTRLAAELRIDISILQHLNPALLQGCSPPDTVYILRLPPGMKNAARIALADMDIPSAEGNSLRLHTVKKGDTLWSIAKAAGCTIAILCEINKINDINVLATGKILYLPQKDADIQ